jgi:cytochrome c-type biogenesis protein CcmH
MLLAILLLGVTAIVLATVLGPLMKSTRAPVERAAFDRAIYRDQLKELDRDAARGVVGTDEAAAARLELQRRLLAAEKDDAPTSSGARLPVVAIVLSTILVTVAGGIYLRLGSPSLPDLPYADRAAERSKDVQAQAQLTQIRAMVAKLAEEMASKPDDLEGWLRLGRSYSVLNQPAEAQAAFAHAETLKPNDTAVMMAETEAMLAGHAPTDPIPDPVVTLLRRVIAIDPKVPAALWYLGLHAAQQGAFAEARNDWQKLQGVLPADGDEQKMVAAALDAIKDR